MSRRARAAFVFCLAGGFFANAAAGETARKTIWDLVPGAPLAGQPAPNEYRAYACGARGGPPRRPLKSFADFASCAPEADGLHEVTFEYDDELEYIARARDLEREISLHAGTTEQGYPVVVSALFDAAGVLRGLRLVTDARPDYRRDVTEADTRRRENAHQFGAVLANRFGVDPAEDCKSSPPADGESAVGSVFVKLDCEKTDAAAHRRYLLSVRMLRKPGQSGRDPRQPSRLTSGQFESSARLEIYETP